MQAIGYFRVTISIIKMMKKIVTFVFLCLALYSCQSEKERTAQKAIDRYVIFVDSVNQADFQRRALRWDFIEQEYIRKRTDAERALNAFDEDKKQKEQKRIDERAEKYEAVRISIEEK